MPAPAPLRPPFSDSLPAQIVFRAADLPQAASYPQHRHAWGEFVYAYHGVMELELGERQLLVPPQYGVWLPPEVEHRGLNRRAAAHASLYIAAPLCAGLPAQPCALAVGPLLRTLLQHLREQPPPQPPQPANERLLRVVLDQLLAAEPSGSYLPGSSDPLLAPVLDALARNPADARSVADWARLVHSTERSLQRRCQQQLGMPLAEWRQRLCIVRALPRLEAGDKLDAIALDLGYSGAAAFIALFKRRMGMTPEAFRQQAHRAHPRGRQNPPP